MFGFAVGIVIVRLGVAVGFDGLDFGGVIGPNLSRLGPDFDPPKCDIVRNHFVGRPNVQFGRRRRKGTKQIGK